MLTGTDDDSRLQCRLQSRAAAHRECTGSPSKKSDLNKSCCSSGVHRESDLVITKLFRSDSRCTPDEQHDLFRSDFLDLNVVSII